MTDQFPKSTDITTLSVDEQKELLKTLIDLENCKRNPETILDSVSDYDVYNEFLSIIGSLPDILSIVLQGQLRASQIDNYKPAPGILVFQTTGHAHFLERALNSIKAIMELRKWATDRNLYVNPIDLRVFIYHYNRAVGRMPSEMNHDDIVTLKIGESFGYDQETQELMREYLKKSYRNLELQQGSAFEKQDRALAAEPKYES